MTKSPSAVATAPSRTPPKVIRLAGSPAENAAIVERFRARELPSALSYATVRDYCDSLDFLPQITGLDGDLKNVQRPWAAKTLLACLPPPARLLEIGGGQPVVSGLLAELGYDVTLVDPYDGFGNGPTDYQLYVTQFPHVKIVRGYLAPDLPELAGASFDAIFSISVIEHIPHEPLERCFEAIRQFLKPGGVSLHCFDFVLQGAAEEHALAHAREILALQRKLAGQTTGTEENLTALVEEMKADVETFYLSPQGHHHWRGGRPYDEFPFRKVVSIQTRVTAR